jgi:peptidylprolyl isomerase
MRLHSLPALLALALLAVGCGDPAPEALKELKTTDTIVGKGPEAYVGDIVVVQYTGKLANGKEFDSNDNATEKPLIFKVGEEPLQLILGLDTGIRGMKVGGERDLAVPAAMGYGPIENGSIPANSDLFFHVKLIYVMKKDAPIAPDVIEEKPGVGPAVKPGDLVTIKYAAYFLSGMPFDSMASFQFVAGTGLTPSGSARVPEGLNQSVIGMRKGGTRTVVVPPRLLTELAATGVEPKDFMKFEIELLNIGK